MRDLRKPFAQLAAALKLKSPASGMPPRKLQVQRPGMARGPAGIFATQQGPGDLRASLRRGCVRLTLGAVSFKFRSFVQVGKGTRWRAACSPVEAAACGGCVGIPAVSEPTGPVASDSGNSESRSAPYAKGKCLYPPHSRGGGRCTCSVVIFVAGWRIEPYC